MKTNINKLENIDKSNPFRVPENYFAQFNKDIMNKLPIKETPVSISATKHVTLWSKARPWIYAAAVFLFMFIGFQYYKSSVIERTANEPVAAVQPYSINGSNDTYWSNINISETDFYQYLEEQLTEDNYYDFIYDQLHSNTSM